ncbi:MAG: M14 family metallopeptidase [Gemmatimonadetes bacterium]|nr:M14 family metallopeptidase [Gemmatimonadota bacterium]
MHATLRHAPLLSRLLVLIAVASLPTATLRAQSNITNPLQEFGFNIGDDYHLANYTQLEAYWRTLERESPRMVLEEIGRTAEGRPHLMAIITSPENHRNLARYKEISRRLALAEGLTEPEARALATEGKAIVWIDGGLHATEVLGAHQLMETVYQMVSRTDRETLRFLADNILLAVHANPDGMELVSNWYMREPEPTNRRPGGIPRLYQKYIGHDNNRDSYMVTQPETENMSRIMYRDWYPQIMYNHHQTGPAGTVMFAPPFRDPFNYVYDPLIPLGIQAFGTAIHTRLAAEGKPGTTMRSGASYSTWFNGNVRTTGYFHNQIGMLTETIGNPTPVRVPFLPNRQLPNGDQPFPIEPQEWHFRQSIDYSITANWAVMDHASRNRENLLYNRYVMGRNSIERGSRDHWTIHPKIIDAVNAAVAADASQATQPQGFGGRFRGVPDSYFAMLRDPADRDPRGYILPSDQPDFPTAAKFINTLVKNGVTIHQATRDFQVAGKDYPAGSFVVKTAQAFRPHVLDMFEPQDHPNDFAYEGGPPIPPYDNAGYTLAFTMGIEFDRVLEAFDGPFERLEGLAAPLAGEISNPDAAAGFLLSHAVSDAFIATNRLMAGDHEVYWLTEPLSANGTTYPAGTIYIPATTATRSMLESMATELGLDFHGIRVAPSGNALRVRPVRIGLWDQYGGSMPSGWTRWLFEQFEFPFELVFPQELDRGNLNDKFDVLVFNTGAIPGTGGGPGFGRRGGFGGGGPSPESIPEEYRSWLGRVTTAETVPRLLEFLQAGGTILAIGSSTSLAQHAGLPLTNHLVDGMGNPLSRNDYYVPSSVLQVKVDNTRPLAYGVKERLDVFFNNNPVLRLMPEAQMAGVKPVAWFDTKEPLRSGWAWGQHHLDGGLAVAEAKVGRGTLYLFGPLVLFRGQPHGTFKLLFNGIHLAGTTPVRMEERATGGAN